MTKAPTLVLTRPRRQSEALARALRAQVPGLEVVISPILEIRPTDAEVSLEGVAGVILTSARALRFVPWLDGLPAYCVGPRTAEAARIAGAQVRGVFDDADALVAQIDAPAPLLHLRGVHGAGEIAARLTAAGRATREVVVYDQAALPLSDQAISVIEGNQPAVLPLYSTRSAHLVGSAIAAPGVNLRVIAMSDTVGRAWADKTGGTATTCDHPNGDEMMRRVVAALRDPSA